MSTTSKWFVPNEEYSASTEDYALVGASATYVKNHLIDDPDFHDLSGWLPEKTEPKFSDVLDLPQHHGDLFHDCGYCEPSQLVYADVDRDNEKHVQAVKDAAKSGLVEKPSKEVQAMKEKILENMTRSYDSLSDDEDDMTPTERQEYLAATEKARKADLEKARKILDARDGLAAFGYISYTMLDFVLGLEDEEERRHALTIISRQYQRKNPRPVLLLLGMIDKFTPGVKEGWLIGYDFCKNDVIIRPYHAMNGTEHPLAEKWNVELPDDGVSWKGSPAAFINDKFLPLHEEIRKNNEELNEANDTNATQGYKLLAYHSVATWIINHGVALASIAKADGEMTLDHKISRKIRNCLEAIRDETAFVQFPYTKDDSVKDSASTMSSLQYVQEMLEDREACVREDALDAQKAGKEDRAQNMAKLYGKLLEQLRSFNMNPDKPL